MRAVTAPAQSPRSWSDARSYNSSACASLSRERPMITSSILNESFAIYSQQFTSSRRARRIFHAIRKLPLRGKWSRLSCGLFAQSCQHLIDLLLEFGRCCDDESAVKDIDAADRSACLAPTVGRDCILDYFAQLIDLFHGSVSG